MLVAFTVILVISAATLVSVYLGLMTEKKIRDEIGHFSIIGIVAAIMLAVVTIFLSVAILYNVERDADSSVIDLDNCRYVGAEVYTTDDDHTVFIDITSGDGALYAYDGQVDATAQYMLTLDAKTGDVLVVWQNVN